MPSHGSVMAGNGDGNAFGVVGWLVVAAALRSQAGRRCWRSRCETVRAAVDGRVAHRLPAAASARYQRLFLDDVVAGA